MESPEPEAEQPCMNDCLPRSDPWSWYHSSRSRAEHCGERPQHVGRRLQNHAWESAVDAWWHPSWGPYRQRPQASRGYRQTGVIYEEVSWWGNHEQDYTSIRPHQSSSQRLMPWLDVEGGAFRHPELNGTCRAASSAAARCMLRRKGPYLKARPAAGITEMQLAEMLEWGVSSLHCSIIFKPGWERFQDDEFAQVEFQCKKCGVSSTCWEAALSHAGSIRHGSLRTPWVASQVERVLKLGPQSMHVDP